MAQKYYLGIDIIKTYAYIYVYILSIKEREAMSLRNIHRKDWSEEGEGEK